ncbi:MAG: ParB N-terminal domain-containing protein [Desulfobacterales bacterium]
MQAEQQIIETAFVDLSDPSYLFTDQHGIESLADSLRNLGLIAPPVVQLRQQGGMRVVAGFRRISACVHLELPRIHARILPPETASLYCLQVAAADNAAARTLNLGEQCRLVEKLYGLCGSKQAVSKALQSSGLCIPAEMTDKLLRVSALPEPVKAGVAQNYISINTALALQSMPGRSAIAVAEVFDILRPTLNQQREILAGLNELAALQDSGIDSLLKNPELVRILNSPDIDRGRRLNMFRSEIRRRRYPWLSRAEAEFLSRRRNLGLDENMDLKPPANFEDTKYTFTVRFSTAGQLCRSAEKLEKICRHPELHAILNREIEDPPDIY